MKKILVNGAYHYALMENGDLYYWNANNYFSPVLVTKQVLNFEISDYFAMVLKEDGLMELWNCLSEPVSLDSTISYFVGKNVTSFAFYYSSGGSYYCTADGSTYAWGRWNDDGQLGVGTNEFVPEPALINLDGVVDIAVSWNTAYFLTANGQLYYSGSDNHVMEPMLLAENVKAFTEICYSSYIAVEMTDGTFVYCYPADSNRTQYIPEREMDKILLSSSEGDAFGILDGEVFKRDYDQSTYNYVWTKVEGICNAVDIYNYGGFCYVITEDGLLYGFGQQNGNNHTAGQSVDINVSVPVLITMEYAKETISLMDSNLGEEHVLTGDDLLLTFNKKIVSVSGVKLYEDGIQITVNNHVENHNYLRLNRSAGFKEGVNYRLVIPAGNMTASANATNREDIVVEFTWTASAAPTPDEGGEGTEVQEPVYHAAVLDETVERFYWSVRTFVERIRQVKETETVNPIFVGNAILNRLSTDTDVTHWLRVRSAESSNPTTINLGGNYWGTTNESAIGLQIIDYSDFPNYAKLDYKPYLTTAPENTFPFVTDIAILNKAGEAVSTVGNEEITVQIYFNRDMDTSMPLRVVFGSAFPYGDYEIQGSFISPRCWQGTHLLTTIIENGYQLFTVSNGCTADGLLDLWPDQGRFGFVIDTTAAQALIMQGNATDTGIQLKWTQDDFDTLMGYNVYRSTSEDGYYQRLNSTVIPAEQMEFFDDTVEPGVQYYYNFTVVKTDLTESTPSGKITIMSRDTMAPDIYHSPVYNATTGQNLVISATVTDNLNIIYSNVYYRIAGTEEWKTVRMNNLNSKYSAIIPASDITMAGLEYYLEAFDGVSYTYKGSAEKPFFVTVQEAVDKNSLGDVNGDGVISNLDALLLLLYAINDKVNLSAEEFARADLNGDGLLWAAEALRILQYVSGVAGSVTMP